jgi:hypothetical protein
MNYTKLSTLNEKLKNVPKDIVVLLLHNYLKFKSEHEIDILIIDAKLDNNLNQQKEVLNKIDEHGQCDTKDTIKWLRHHNEWEHLNAIYNNIYKEYEILYKQREKLNKEVIE